MNISKWVSCTYWILSLVYNLSDSCWTLWTYLGYLKSKTCIFEPYQLSKYSKDCASGTTEPCIALKRHWKVFWHKRNTILVEPKILGKKKVRFTDFLARYWIEPWPLCSFLWYKLEWTICFNQFRYYLLFFLLRIKLV